MTGMFSPSVPKAPAMPKEADANFMAKQAARKVKAEQTQTILTSPLGVSPVGKSILGV